MLFSIDRIVAGRAMLIDEGGKPMEVPVAMLPDGMRAGDMVEYEGERFIPANDKAHERRERVAGMLEHLLRHGNDEE